MCYRSLTSKFDCSRTLREHQSVSRPNLPAAGGCADAMAKSRKAMNIMGCGGNGRLD